ncbi:hypothetical protein [Nitrosophilus labii]|uniref:hypothetical protein n=1 Tax=Nitrosophilus labii TaxID=2706014 RepID=UPI00165713CD|nr:hypothetical protein [Nitrosophilus labii]
MDTKNRLFIKKKDFEINNLKNEIKELANKIETLEKKISQNIETYVNRENKKFQEPMALILKELFLSTLLKENEYLKREKTKISSILKKKQEELSILLGEKKAFESYLQKKKREKELKENEIENRLANEIFLRNFSNK